MIDRDEIGRRIRAARELRGISQTELDGKLAEDGWGKLDAGRLERGDLRVPFTPGRRDSLVRHLRVPGRWFTADDVDEIVGYSESDEQEKIDVILAAVLDMQEKLNQRYDQLGEIVRERHEMERRIRHLTAEEADEMVRMLAEARMRQGRDIGLRSSQAGHATDRQTGS